MFRILSIDGGGLRGIIPVKILQHIELLTGRKVHESFDFFAGTSTGGLIVSGLTVCKTGNPTPRYSLDDIENIYSSQGKDIFPIKSNFHKWWRRQTISYLFRPQFKEDGIHRVLSNLLVDDNDYHPRILDCCRPIFITTYDLRTNSPLYFKSRHAYYDSTKNAKLIDVCRATSAGPTYLPSYSFNFEHEYGRIKTNTITGIDGGVFMNNPSMGALVEILKYRGDKYYNLGDLRDEDIFLLSIGTGRFSSDISAKSKRWGKLGWMKPAIDIMMWGNNQAVDFHVKEGLTYQRIGRINYLRLNIDILDEKYADMANSDSETLNYLVDRVRKDYLNNASVQNQISDFIVSAGL